jgi:phosphate:Na+ symporter
MSNVVEKLFKVFQLVYTNPGQRLSEGVQQGKELEDLTDQMQEEISRFLVECSKEQLSETNVNNLNAMMRIAHELESIADSCYNLIILAQQKYNKHIQIHHNAHESIQAYSKLVFSFIQFYQENIDQSFDNHQMQIAFQLENQVNQYRHDFNKSAQKRLQKGSDVRSELLYLDLIKNFEHIGDNALNIAQALRQMR